MFHYLRSRQAATAEKITGSGGRTRYSITRTMLRRVLMNKDLNLVHSSRLPVPEVDIILHLLPVQVDLYSVTFAFVACAVRRVHLRDFYNSEECTSVVRRYELTILRQLWLQITMIYFRLLQNLNKYCSQRDILRRSKKSMMSTSMAVPPVDSSKTSWSVDQSMFLAEVKHSCVGLSSTNIIICKDLRRNKGTINEAPRQGRLVFAGYVQNILRCKPPRGA